MKNIVYTFIISSLVSLPSMGMAFSKTIEITEQSLQEQVDNFMPVTQKELLYSITISEPNIDLIKDSDRIGLAAKVSMTLIGDITGDADIAISGKPSYNAEKGAFYLTDIDIIDIQSKQLDTQYIPTIKRASKNLLNEILKTQPVYQLQDSTKEQLLKATLKNIEIKNETLYAELGLF